MKRSFDSSAVARNSFSAPGQAGNVHLSPEADACDFFGYVQQHQQTGGTACTVLLLFGGRRGGRRHV
jgi:hypothetical protein